MCTKVMELRICEYIDLCARGLLLRVRVCVRVGVSVFLCGECVCLCVFCVCILCVLCVCVLCGCCSMLLDKWRKEGSSPALHTSDGR